MAFQNGKLPMGVGGGEPPTLRVAQAYCRRLARTHYENFTVASRLLPKDLRQHFANVYAYCRCADDLADETGDLDESLDLLNWWESQLDDCCAGKAAHPVFVALAETIGRFDLPEKPFRDLLAAFRRDQRQTRYETFDELLDYCRCSANPVGRIVLHLGRFHDDRTAPLADSICTGLQLANFWQDVARDYDQGRIYLPQETMRQFGLNEETFSQRTATDSFRSALRFEVDRAESFFTAGRPLLDLTPRPLHVDVQLFIAGGLAILDAIRRRRYDVWTRRPTVGKIQKLKLLIAAWCKKGSGVRGQGREKDEGLSTKD